MKERSLSGEIISRCLKVLGVSYVVSALMLVVIAAAVYKFGVSEKVVAIGIVLVYIVSCLVGGLLMGKLMKTRKFLWGLLLGVMYFVALFILTGIVGRGFSQIASDVGTTLFLCLGSGMLGGMLS
ncbi:MAG: TIGR04086 family membrane protein [Lachnospiraceae bacterium]|nr:TIGR04086 family membrane protein [Lachnospiraceae bacterium]